MLLCSTEAAAGGAYDELTARDLSRLERQAAAWVLEMEARHRPAARALSGAEKDAFAGFFGAELLERARLREVSGIENPEFYQRFFADRGQPLPIDFRRASGLALLDTVLIVAWRVPPDSPGWLPILFHELVHLAQVERLGREGHVADYVRGWAANDFTYRSIPREAQAFELAERFRRAPGRPFSVAAEVARRFPPPDGVAGEATVDRRP